MKTFKNIKAATRAWDGEATMIMFCEAEVAPSQDWVECDPKENKYRQLFLKNGVRYFGRL